MANREIDIGQKVHPLIRVTESSLYSFGEGTFLGHRIDMSQVKCKPEEMLQPLGLSVFFRNAVECVELGQGGLVWEHEYVKLVRGKLFDSFKGVKKVMALSSAREDNLLSDGDVSYDEHIPFSEWDTDFCLELGETYEIDRDFTY